MRGGRPCSRSCRRGRAPKAMVSTVNTTPIHQVHESKRASTIAAIVARGVSRRNSQSGRGIRRTCRPPRRRRRRSTARSSRSRPGGHLVVAALLGDDDAQLGVEVERLQAIEAAARGGLGSTRALCRAARRRGSAVELLQRFVAVSHGVALCPVGVVAMSADPRREPRARANSYNRLLHRLSSPVQPGHHRTDRDVQHLGDLLVREALHVGQQHGHAEVLGQLLERGLHLVVGEQVHQRSSALRLASAASSPPMRRYRYRSSTSSRSVSSGRRCLARYELMNVFVRMRYSHARRLVPSSNVRSCGTP